MFILFVHGGGENQIIEIFLFKAKHLKWQILVKLQLIMTCKNVEVVIHTREYRKYFKTLFMKNFRKSFNKMGKILLIINIMQEIFNFYTKSVVYLNILVGVFLYNITND